MSWTPPCSSIGVLQGAELNCCCLVQAVALGAAIQAGMLEGTLGDLMVMDPLQAGLLRALAGRRAKAQKLQDVSEEEAARSISPD